MWIIYYENLLFFRKNSVKSTILQKKILNNWFDEKNFSEREFLVFPHCVEKHEILSRRKFFREISSLQGCSWQSVIFEFDTMAVVYPLHMNVLHHFAQN